MIIEKAELPGAKFHSRGKVRDIFDLGDALLIVSTDRLSAFDYVLPDPIPDKGKVLNRLSEFWFGMTREIVGNHVITTNIAEYPEALKKHSKILEGRSMIVKKAEMIGIECVARGYLSGSAWKEYRNSGTLAGEKLPEGLKESSKLPEPIFSPSTKATSGHDENIRFAEVEREVGKEMAGVLKELTLRLYAFASRYAETKGIIIADTKFEFGFSGGEIIVADEMLTPDSSRFWPKDSYVSGQPQPSYDKQFVRDHLERVGWDKKPPVPRLPSEVIEGTAQKYREIFRILTGKELT